MGIIGKPVLNLPRSGYLTFSSPTAFSLSIIGNPLWDGTIEYSTNRYSWNVWTGLTTLNAVAYNGYYVLYVRGKNNTYITGANAATNNGAWHFTGSDISISGELIHLLDFKKRTSPAVKAFDSLFGWKDPGDTAIVSARDFILPEVLNTQCCRSMFSRCKGLLYVPKFPAMTLAEGCYNTIFYQCEALNTLPVLPALTLPNTCYSSMFNSCSSIKISTTKTGEYQNEFRVPSTGTGTVGTDSLKNMFYKNGGTFSSPGTPTVNTTYYTSNSVIS